MKVLKSAIIGLGNIAQSHIQAVKGGECGEVVTVCDIVPEKITKYVDTHQLKVKTYTDYVQMLDECDIDLVHICTPHYLHKEMIVSALKRNVNVLCEKPICISEEELAEIKVALENTKAKLGVVQQNRYNESAKYMKSYLKDKKIRSGYATLVWNRDEEYYSQDDWHGVLAKEGGGVIINQALHTLDLMQYYMGMPHSVCGKVDTFALKNIIDVEDTAVARFYTENASFGIYATNTSEANFPVHIVFRLEGGEEAILFPAAVLTKEGYKTFIENKPLGKKCYGSGHEKLIADFYECVKNDKPFAIDFNEASKVAKMIFALYRSNGEMVEIKN